MAHDVFISYSSTDQHAALAVLHGLESAGVRCWMAPRDIQPGAIWAQAIMEGIANCRILVVVFSASANKSSHVINEVDAAVRKGAIIVPFRIEDVMPDGAMEYHLRTRHWLDALTPDLEQHTARLASQIRGLLDSHDHPEPIPTPPPKPLPEELRGVRPAQTRRSLPSDRPPRRWKLPLLVGAAAVAAGGYWFTRERPIREVTFTVREVSSSGGNESTMRLRSGGLRFFEAGENIPGMAQRTYATTFASGATRYVDVELKLLYEAPGREVTIPIGCSLARQGGQVVAEITINTHIQPTWTESYHAQGWGTSKGGWWQPGKYRVECRYDRKLIARDWFEVAAGGDVASRPSPPPPPEAAPPPAPASSAVTLRQIRGRVTGLRLYESGAETVPHEAREYTTRFPSTSTRYVNIEVNLAYPALAQETSVPITCQFLRNRTDAVGTVRLKSPIQAGWTSSWHSGGWGTREPGSWAPGYYLVRCEDAERTVGQTSFLVQ